MPKASENYTFEEVIAFFTKENLEALTPEEYATLGKVAYLVIDYGKFREIRDKDGGFDRRFAELEGEPTP